MPISPIYYHPEAFATNGERLMGSNAEGEFFLRGLFSYSKLESFYAQVIKPEHALDFESKLNLSGRSELVVAITNSYHACLKLAPFTTHRPKLSSAPWEVQYRYYFSIASIGGRACSLPYLYECTKN
jgi:hypothetical protein